MADRLQAGSYGMTPEFDASVGACLQAILFACKQAPTGACGVFLVDATLIRRILRGEAFYEAHRSHAYQFASRHYASHTPVSLGVGAINLAWLLPWAVLVATGALPALLGLVVAWVPVVGVAVWFGAGAVEG